MNVLDENISEEQRELLRSRGIAVRHIGYDVGRSGMKDDEIIPLLHQFRGPTFFTRDFDFYKRGLCHANYCLVYLAIEPDEVADFVRRLLRYPRFNTEAKRMGVVMRASRVGITAWRLHAEEQVELTWAE